MIPQGVKMVFLFIAALLKYVLILAEGEHDDVHRRRKPIRPKEIPPLRERPEDIPLLIEHFLKVKPDYNKYYFSPDAVEKMLSYEWPGNIRELKNCVYRAVSLCERDLVCPEHISFD